MVQNILRLNPKSRWKLLFITAGLLISIGFFAVFAVYAVQYARRHAHDRRAAALFSAGDHARAEPLLLASIREDRNNEAAWEQLAVIHEHRQHWRQAAECWRFLTGLNPQEKRYTENYCEALFRTQAYTKLIHLLQYWPEERKKTYAAILATAYLLNGQDEKAREVLALAPRIDTDRLRLAHLLATIRQSGFTTDAAAQLAALTASPDTAVVFAALSLQAEQDLRRGAFQDAEKHLRRMVAVHPEAAYPLLGDFYYERRRYPEAVSSYRAAGKNGLPPGSIPLYAEALFFVGDENSLRHLAADIPQNNRALMSCRLYAEAVLAYKTHDLSALHEKLSPLQTPVQTPLAMVMRFDCALQSRDIPMLSSVLQEMTGHPQLNDFRTTAFPKVEAILTEFYNSGRLAEVAELAEQLRLQHPNNLLLLRIGLLNPHRNAPVPRYELEHALKSFPDDPIVLTVAAEQFNRQGDYVRALAAAERNAANGHATPHVKLQCAHALEGLSRPADARKVYAELRQAYPADMVVWKRLLAFSLRNAEPLPTVPTAATAAPTWRKLLDGETARRQKQKVRMVECFAAPELLDVLDPAKAEDLPLLFYLAQRLAEADAAVPAIAVYEKIQPVVSDPLLIRLNLSELYAAIGQKTPALQAAYQAWRADSRNPTVNACYGLRQWEAGHCDEAIALLEPLLAKPTADARIAPAWRDAMARAIAENFARKKYPACLELCRRLLKKYPDHPVALEFKTKAQLKLDTEKSPKE